MALELYAKIEHLIGFEESYDYLYELYLEHLKRLEIDTILDVGCGSGKFLQKLNKSSYDALGIDLSSKMVEVSISKGLDAKQIDICDVKDSYDAILCVADVLNYMDNNELKRFFGCLKKRLNKNGYFLCDINTLYGFSDVANGTMVKDFDDKFLSIDAEFKDGILKSDFTLFEKIEDNLYAKESGTILQYFHTIKSIKSIIGLKFVKKEEIKLFADVSDKTMLIFQKAPNE